MNVTLDLFGGINNKEAEQHFLIKKTSEIPFSAHIFPDINCYYIFNKVVSTSDGSILLIETDKGDFIKVPIIGKVLFIEKDNNDKYIIYQSTQSGKRDRIMIYIVDNDGLIKMKNLIVNIKDYDNIKYMCTSPGYYLFVDGQNRMYLSSKKDDKITDHCISTVTQAYIGEEINVSAAVSKSRIFEFDNFLVIYLYDTEKCFAVRILIDKYSYELLSYDVIGYFKNCDHFDGSAMIALDAFAQQNKKNKIEIEKIIYMRNDGNNIIVGYKDDKDKDKLLHIVLNADDLSKVKIINKFYCPNDFRIDKILKVNFNDGEALLLLNANDEGISYIICDHLNKLSEIQHVNMEQYQTILTICSKELSLPISIQVIDKNHKEDIQPSNSFGTMDEFDQEYEYDFTQLDNDNNIIQTEANISHNHVNIHENNTIGNQ